jgi:biotin transport system substrate-specific component
MIKAAVQAIPVPKTRDIIEVLLASLFIAFFAQVRIPYGPIPHTLQTFAVFLIALMMGPKKSMAACLCYLGEATLGLPVTAGLVSKPLWFTGMTGGFLFGFPVAAYVTSSMELMWKKRTFFTSFVSVTAGNIVLFALGVSWLAMFVGVQSAITFGLMPFILTSVIKNAAAAGVYHGIFKK